MDKTCDREQTGTWRSVVLDTYDFISDDLAFDSIPLSPEPSHDRQVWNTNIYIGRLIWNYLYQTKDNTQ